MKWSGQAKETAERLREELLERQSPDGAWRLCCESGVMSDAFLLILLKAMDWMEDHRELARRIAQRIAVLQEDGGGWKLHEDQKEGHLESTVEAYYALLATGYYEYGDPRMVNARRFILARGGLGEVRTMMTQVLLCMTGQLDWPRVLRIPVETLLAPSWLPLSLFDLSGHARVHLVPVLMLASGSFKLGDGRLPNLSELVAGESRSFLKPPSLPGPLAGMAEALAAGHSPLYPASLDKGEKFMLDRIEPNGTLLTYSTATILMIAALVSIGYPPSHEVIRRGLDGIRSLVWDDPRHEISHLQIASSTVWDTAMLGCVLHESGLSADHDALQRAAGYIASRQQTAKGDWARRNPRTPPGGWGFSDVNTRYPDIDDTTASLSMLQRIPAADAFPDEARERGDRWVWSMQNKDGGWPAFERESGSPLIGLIQFEQASQIVTDPSTVDLTARTLAWSSRRNDPAPSWVSAAVDPGEGGQDPQGDAAVRAAAWILKQQQRSGCWPGRWGIAYVHGTGAAITGLMAMRAKRSASALYRGMNWLLSVQNADGGWGESCFSDVASEYRALGASTPSQTAWALEGLMAHPSSPPVAIDRGIECLIELLEADDWRSRYPTGGGLPGHVYLNYHSSRYIWPLRVLSAYAASAASKLNGAEPKS
ncbi:prenyltransferase/squalene oxidase repeat-containing protein [Paenibacillus sp. D9]|uniref:prenyltransferase/squalene oxidase repeat-containing protein n=1 Tax=Paenibacillus sp. D9 TaxID=665792 RepID=UPI000675EA0B|nr:prenyltransferase/squalene oxidase repeat-containing protein [Paenibacillus sp. D9]